MQSESFRRRATFMVASLTAAGLMATACVPDPQGPSGETTTTSTTTSTTTTTTEAPPEPILPHITEIHYDNAGTDTGEAIEVTAEPNTDLSGWTIVLYNGTNNQAAAPTYGTARALGTTNEVGVYVLTYPVDGLQNGSFDAIALVRPNGTVAEFLSYEGVIVAGTGPAAGMTSTDIGVSEPSTTAVGQSLQLIDGVWVGPIANTFGALNGGGGPVDPEPQCVAATHTIGAVQGSGAATPLDNQTVTVRGVVVGDLQVGGYNGYYVQDAGDGDPATSDGIFVYDPDGTPAVNLGDQVSVTGRANEFSGLTQLSDVTAAVCATGVAAPTPAVVSLPASDTDLERFESMSVSLAGTLSVTEVYNLNRYGEVVVSTGGILTAPTEVAEPGAAAQAVMAQNADRSIIIDDGLTTNLSTANVAPPYLGVNTPVRVGDTVATLQPSVLSYGFNAFRLQPADGTASGTTFAATNPRSAVPANVGGNLKVASFNVLNYFVTYGANARGAANEAQKNLQEAKIVSAIGALGADVVGLQEIENSAVTTPATPYIALQTLVNALNTAAGSNVWSFVQAHEASDVITNAIIYRNDRVSPVGAPIVATETAVWANAREPIAQAFTNGLDTFTLIVNHFKSKGSGTGTGNIDSGDGQGASNADRVAQATALVAFAGDVVAQNGDSDVMMIGDFNSYGKEDPIDVIVAAGFADLVPLAGGKHSYVFDGASGSLDRMFMSPSLAAKVAGFDIWNINAVESYGYQYDGFAGLYAPFAYRASDHDPEIVGLNLGVAIPH